VLGMLLLGLGENQDIINENENEFIKIFVVVVNRQMP
jgi:hypothetical protein